VCIGIWLSSSDCGSAPIFYFGSAPFCAAVFIWFCDVIWHAIGHQPFGISAHRRLPNGTNEPLTRSCDMIEWYDTLKACKTRAERILRAHLVRFQ
jgi:hypothetical protein